MEHYSYHGVADMKADFLSQIVSKDSSYIWLYLATFHIASDKDEVLI